MKQQVTCYDLSEGDQISPWISMNSMNPWPPREATSLETSVHNDTLRLTWLDTKNKHHKKKHPTSPQILRNLMALLENKQILFNKSRANIRNGCTDFSSSNIYHPNPTELKATCLSHSPSITSIWKVCGCNACSLNCFGSRGVKPIHRYFC